MTLRPIPSATEHVLSRRAYDLWLGLLHTSWLYDSARLRMVMNDLGRPDPEGVLRRVGMLS